jgi:hypothetical protein
VEDRGFADSGVRQRLASLATVDFATVELWFTRLMVCEGANVDGCQHTVRLSYFKDAPVACCALCGQPYFRKGPVLERDYGYVPTRREDQDIRRFWTSLQTMAETGVLNMEGGLDLPGRVRTHCKKGPWCRAGDHWHA